MLPETMKFSDDLLERQRRGREDFSAFFISPPARLLRLTEQFIACNTAVSARPHLPKPNRQGARVPTCASPALRPPRCRASRTGPPGRSTDPFPLKADHPMLTARRAQP